MSVGSSCTRSRAADLRSLLVGSLYKGCGFCRSPLPLRYFSTEVAAQFAGSDFLRCPQLKGTTSCSLRVGRTARALDPRGAHCEGSLGVGERGHTSFCSRDQQSPLVRKKGPHTQKRHDAHPHTCTNTTRWRAQTCTPLKDGLYSNRICVFRPEHLRQNLHRGALWQHGMRGLARLPPRQTATQLTRVKLWTLPCWWVPSWGSAHMTIWVRACSGVNPSGSPERDEWTAVRPKHSWWPVGRHTVSSGSMPTRCSPRLFPTYPRAEGTDLGTTTAMLMSSGMAMQDNIHSVDVRSQEIFTGELKRRQTANNFEQQTSTARMTSSTCGVRQTRMRATSNCICKAPWTQWRF